MEVRTVTDTFAADWTAALNAASGPDAVQLKYTEALRLVKWTGEAPPDGTDPIGHPQCEEVVELDPQTGASRVIYRRD